MKTAFKKKVQDSFQLQDWKERVPNQKADILEDFKCGLSHPSMLWINPPRTPREKEKKQVEKLFQPVLHSVKKTDSTSNRYKVGEVNLCEDILRQQVSFEENMKNPEPYISINMKQ